MTTHLSEGSNSSNRGGPHIFPDRMGYFRVGTQRTCWTSEALSIQNFMMKEMPSCFCRNGALCALCRKCMSGGLNP